jgi:hypothetical protein
MEKQVYYEGSDADSLRQLTGDSTTQVVGTTELYENGSIRYIPMPTPNPKGTHQSMIIVNMLCSNNILPQILLTFQNGARLQQSRLYAFVCILLNRFH